MDTIEAQLESLLGEPTQDDGSEAYAKRRRYRILLNGIGEYKAQRLRVDAWEDLTGWTTIVDEVITAIRSDDYKVVWSN